MKKIENQPFVIFDVETTGLSPQYGDRIIEIAGIKIQGGNILDRFSSLVDPLRPVSYGAYLVNGISAEMLEGAPTADKVIPQFMDFARDSCLVGHNIRFDLSFLKSELARLDREDELTHSYVDTVRMAKALYPEAGRYSLLNLAQLFSVANEQSHRAMGDVILTVGVFGRLVERARQQGIVGAPMLMEFFGKNCSPDQVSGVSNLALIQDAIAQSKILQLRYFAARSPYFSFTCVTPRRIIGSGENCSMSGYCHSSQGHRQFKLRRIIEAEVTEISK